MGGVGGGVGGATVGMVVAFLGAPVAVTVLAGVGVFTAAVGGSYWLSRAIYRSVVASKTVQLESLADRLAVHCEDVAN